MDWVVVSQNSYMEVLHLVAQEMSVCGESIFKEVIR